jgi:long-chain acyl-CoA synthetase
MTTLLDLLDTSVARYGDRPALALRRDDGSTLHWTYRELGARARLAAWRLHALGLQPGDRVLTWSPSTPALPAAYFGVLFNRLIYVPLDQRMATDAIDRIRIKSGAVRLLLGTGRDAPDPREAGLESFPTTTIEDLCAEPDETFPPDWEAQMSAWPRPADDEVFQLVFTSGTTGMPKGVMLAHDNMLAAVGTFHRIVPPMEHRLVSVLPLSHSLEQNVSLYYAMDVGADILYVRSRNPRVIFDGLRDHRVTTMLVVPAMLDLLWLAITREVAKRGKEATFARMRGIARRLPMRLRRVIFRSVHAQLGGSLRLLVSAAAYLPPALQQGFEDLGIVVLQGYGATETAAGAATTFKDHPLGSVGTPPPPIEMRISEDGEIQFRGPTMFKGYWEDPEATKAAFTEDGWYMTGDLGKLDEKGHLILHGRKRDMIVLPNGFNVFPEDIEIALRDAGVRDAVVIETQPGRIEAVVLAPATPIGGSVPTPDQVRDSIAAGVKQANRVLGPNQRIADWRLWPESDFPQTHTMKVKRDPVRRWAAAADAATAKGGLLVPEGG